MKTAVLGASPKPDRYSNKAIRMLVEHDHEVVPVHPVYKEIEGLTVTAALEDLAPESIDTLTMYVNADRSSELADAIVNLQPRRVVFNPGSENPELAQQLAGKGIEVEAACTLVLLRTGAF